MSIITQIHQSKKNKFPVHAQTINSSNFLDLLTHDELVSTIENNIPTYRNTIYTPTKTLSMFLSQSLNEDRSCSKAVNDMIIQSRQKTRRKISANTGAYCLARKKISLDLVTQLTTKSASLITHRAPNHWLWNDRRVRLVDGTSLTMPDTPENQKKYPQSATQKTGVGFPICRLLTVSCLATGAIMNAAIGPLKGKGSDEQSLLRDVLNTFKKGDIMMGDAYFGTYFLFAELIRRGVDGLFEQFGSRRLKTDFGTGKSLGKKDHLMSFKKPKRKPDWITQNAFDKLPEEVVIRECKVGKKILITSMLDAKTYPKKSLQSLYKQRWQVEVDFRHLKTTMGMDILSCKTPEMCEKEIWVYLLASNLLRLLITQSAANNGLIPRNISFKHSLQIWNTYRLCEKIIDDDMLNLMALRIVGNRPGRIEPREIKRRPKAFKLLTIPRSEAKESILKNGHSKKLK
jgi:hypothetical protein